MIRWDGAAQIILNSIFAGIGTALGSYLATKHLTKRFEKLISQVRRLTKPKKKAIKRENK